ncbi:MAG: maleylacetoacetate isomerase, partial [Pseudomonadota bacterium]
SHWIRLGFEALEAKVCAQGSRFCYGDSVTAVDVCLVPQLYNARRFKVPLDDFPGLVAVDAQLSKQKAFSDARPD